MTNDIIRLDNVHKDYWMGDSVIHALEGVSTSIKKGDFVAIMGPSGSGKSTMMNMIGTLAFSFIIGVASGVFPEYQASRLKPVDALRYE